MKFLKINSKIVISFIYHIFIIIGSLFILYKLCSFNFTQKLNDFTKFVAKRKLSLGFEKQKVEDICQKADKDLILLYKSDSFSYVNNDFEMRKSASYLLGYLESKSDLEFKNYIFSFYAQIILLIFDIVLLIVWVALCYYLYKGTYLSCLRKIRTVKKCLKNVFFFTSLSMYAITIIMNIVILWHIPIIFQDFSNSFCSLFKIIYHTYIGEENFYEIRPKWTGINHIKTLIQKTKQNLGNMIDENNQINDMINEIKENNYFNTYKNNFIESHINSFCNLNHNKVPNPYPFNDGIISNFLYCSEILSYIEKDYKEAFEYLFSKINDIYSILQSIKNDMNKLEFSLDNAKNKLDSFIKILKDMEIEYFDKIVHVFETVVRKYFLYIIIFFFIFSFLIGIGGFINMVVLGTCYSIYCNKVFNFVWNFQYLFVMLIVLIIVFSSSINIFIIDISLILKTSVDKDIEDRTFANTKYDMRGINTCINNEGNLSQYMNLDKEAESISHLYSMINIINTNLNYIKNYKIYSEKNETKEKLDELEQKPYLAKFKLFGNDYITFAEEILEKNLNLYTDNETNQDLRDNIYYSKYFFVFDKDFCKSDYKLLINNETDDNYLEGENCMVLKDFPEFSNYFKTIRTKNMELETGYNYYFNDLITKYKQKYYDSDGFEPSFLILLHYSKNYLKNTITVEANKIKNAIINIYDRFANKTNIIHNLYKNILKPNSTDLFSAFNCKYFKRDLYIFIDQLESNLSGTLSKLTIFCSIHGICSFLSIIFSIFYIKLNNSEQNYSEKLFKRKEKLENNYIEEKPKTNTINEKYNFDEILKSNEKTGLKRGSKHKHIMDIEFEKNQ